MRLCAWKPWSTSKSRRCYCGALNLDLQRSTVRCAVILNMEDLQFKLMPLNGQINAAQMNASRQIAEKLADRVDEHMQKRIFLGQP